MHLGANLKHGIALVQASLDDNNSFEQIVLDLSVEFDLSKADARTMAVRILRGLTTQGNTKAKQTLDNRS